MDSTDRKVKKMTVIIGLRKDPDNDHQWVPAYGHTKGPLSAGTIVEVHFGKEYIKRGVIESSDTCEGCMFLRSPSGVPFRCAIIGTPISCGYYDLILKDISDIMEEL